MKLSQSPRYSLEDDDSADGGSLHGPVLADVEVGHDVVK